MEKIMSNEDWIIEEGDEVAQKRAEHGKANLSKWETLVYCLWVADYGMRNAGDLGAAQDVYADFKREGAEISRTIGLKLTHDTFSLDNKAFEKQYFDLFDAICDEIRATKGSD
jgi:predicted HTH transcriptional regulator